MGQNRLAFETYISFSLLYKLMSNLAPSMPPRMPHRREGESMTKKKSFVKLYLVTIQFHFCTKAKVSNYGFIFCTKVVIGNYDFIFCTKVVVDNYNFIL